MPGAQDLVRTVLFVAGATVLLFSLVDVCLLTRSEKETYLRVDSQAQPMNQSHWWISRRRRRHSLDVQIGTREARIC